MQDVESRDGALEDGACLGAGAVLCPKVVIGRNTVAGAGGVVTRDVGPGTVVVGNPGAGVAPRRRRLAGHRRMSGGV